MRRGAHQGGMAARNAMINRTHDLPVVGPCRILARARATAYHQALPVSAEDLALMRQIDEFHIAWPFAGASMLSRTLTRAGQPVGQRPVAKLMTRMGIHALYRKPRPSQWHPAPTVYPSLLRHLKIARPNHVWAADIISIPMKRGFVYLFAILDWASRRVLAWPLSNTLTPDFCMEAAQETLARHGPPAIFNTDHGCQFTRRECTSVLKDHRLHISMDGTGCWRDNVFVEQLWKSVTYEEVYRHAYASVSEAKSGLETYATCYNQRRPHMALDHKTPDEFSFDNLPALRQAV